jgi:hypothetical protein
MTGKKVTRREFVADAGKIGLGVMIVPRHVLGGVGYQAPSLVTRKARWPRS